MSLIPFWRRVIAPATTPELATRVRRELGTKGLPPMDVLPGITLAHLTNPTNDPATQDYPRYFVGFGDSAASVGNNSGVILKAGANRTIVDQIFAWTTAAEEAGVYGFGRTSGAGVRQCVVRNSIYRVVSVVTGAKCSIVEAFAAGPPPASNRITGNVPLPANQLTPIPISWRLTAPDASGLEQLEVWGITVNQRLIVHFYGREWDE